MDVDREHGQQGGVGRGGLNGTYGIFWVVLLVRFLTIGV